MSERRSREAGASRESGAVDRRETAHCSNGPTDGQYSADGADDLAPMCYSLVYMESGTIRAGLDPR